MKERRLQGQIPQGRGPESIAVTRIARDLLQSKIFIRARTIKRDVPNSRRNLRNTGNMLPEIAEHLIRLP